MKNRKFDIQDDELRVIGKTSVPQPEKGKRLWKILLMVLALLAVLAIVLVCIAPKDSLPDKEEGVFEAVPELPSASVEPASLPKIGSSISPDEEGFTEKVDTTINDIPLSLYIPHNAKAELCIKTPDINDPGIIFCAQAADIRKDNGKIVGAFVLKGEPLAWGLSKKGYCAIINDSVIVGVADNSPLFEQATEKGGYFFRQYPLVNDGVLVENEPKNKSFRKAICDRNGEIFVAVSNTPESFHDFAQALVDLGIDNAIYLVGGEYAKGWYRDASGVMTDFSKGRRDRYRYENYVVWRKM